MALRSLGKGRGWTKRIRYPNTWKRPNRQVEEEPCTPQPSGKWKQPVSPAKALRIYEKMRETGETPSISDITGALKACGSYRDLETGRRIHTEVGLANDPKDRISSALIRMYGKCRSVRDANQVFDRLTDPSVHSWNALMSGYVRNGLYQGALEIFEQMRARQLWPDARSFAYAFSAFAGLAKKERALSELGQRWSTESMRVDQCPSGSDSVSPSCLERVRALHAEFKESMEEMSLFVSAALVTAYANCGCMDEAQVVFDESPKRGVPLWNGMIQGYISNGDADRGLALFERMQEEGIVPDTRTFVDVLDACSSLADKEEWKSGFEGKLEKTMCLRRVKEIHSKLADDVDFYLQNKLVDLYTKCGSTYGTP